MKVNFWQILGIILIVVGAILFMRDKTSKNDTRQPSNPAPATAPAGPAATLPATGP